MSSKAHTNGSGSDIIQTQKRASTLSIDKANAVEAALCNAANSDIVQEVPEGWGWTYDGLSEVLTGEFAPHIPRCGPTCEVQVEVTASDTSADKCMVTMTCKPNKQQCADACRAHHGKILKAFGAWAVDENHKVEADISSRNGKSFTAPDVVEP